MSTAKEQRLLVEQNTLTKEGKTYKVQLLRAGQGSSGFYPAEMIEQYGPAAFPAGTQLFWDHLSESEEWDRRGQHSIKDLVGVLTTDPVYNSENQSLEAEAKFFPPASEFVETAFPYFDLSIEGMSYINDDGVVEALIPSPFNAVALVPKGGREGKILSVVESYREKHGNMVSSREHAADEGKETGVKPEEIEAVAEAVVKGLTPYLNAITEALKPAEDEESETEAPDISAVTEAIIEAGLTKTGRARVFEAIKAGKGLEEAVEAEKKLREELLAEQAEEAPGAVETVSKVTESLLDANKVEF
jgi:hypothetical protein